MNGACMFPHGDRFVAQGMFHTNRGTRARGPMFISWAVRSYQSNGAGCDFSQGISVCLIEILYPIQLGSFVASPPSPSFSFVVAMLVCPLNFLSLVSPLVSSLFPFSSKYPYTHIHAHHLLYPLLTRWREKEEEELGGGVGWQQREQNCFSTWLASTLIDIAYRPSRSGSGIVKLPQYTRSEQLSRLRYDDS